MDHSQRKKEFSPPSQFTKNPKNHTRKSSKNVLHIGGIQVEFPYQPYGTQLAFMNRVISTLDRAQRDGHCHALLESPTGTGKSLSLLCSSLAWQQNAKSKNILASLSHSSSKANPEAVTDPINCGGGFIPESQPSSGNEEKGATLGMNGQKKKKKLAPTIFYASRTHSQIHQVIQEYRKTTYRVPMAVLASRKHYCTNKGLCGAENIDEQCKLLLKNKEIGCSEFKNTHKVKGHPSLQKGGSHEAYDIEDLVKIGEVVKGCSYYAARAMADDAELVFCPYNYIISPVIRRAMEVDIEGAIVILDEAHNVEDVARDAGSIDVEEDMLLQLQSELQLLRTTDPMTYQPLLEMIQDILCWMDEKKKTLQKREFQHFFSCWTGDKALAELEVANVTRKCFPILQECASKAFKAASEAELGLACLSGMAATVLEGLFSSFNYFFSENGLHANDYLLAVQKYVKRDGVSGGGGWKHSLNLWCLNPAVVFRGIAGASLSVILTSGTLTPMTSFSSELGVQFGTCLEAPHVVDVESQLWAAVIPRGPGNYPLNSSYKTAEAFSFQDELGTSLEEICKVVPGGCLVFFPSYKLMDKLCNRWQETGQWSRLNAQKSLFIEPRGGSQEALGPVLKSYYNSIKGRSKPMFGRKKRVKKSDQNDIKAVEASHYNMAGGAAFLAVCRGKISEGIDFSDDNARVVIVVGIPFPNTHDIQVVQKKKFNDTFKLSKNLSSGNEWYCNQAFRALNQATGRCIRHRFDYGAIIFLDERFCQERSRIGISKWFRKSIRQYDNFERSLDELKLFFQDVKDHVAKIKFSLIPEVEEDNDISITDKEKEIPTKNNQKGNKLKPSNDFLVTEETTSMGQSFNSVIKSENERNACGCIEYIDLECDTQENSSCSKKLSTVCSLDDPDLTIVSETPNVNGSVPATSENFSNTHFSNLVMLPSSNELPDFSPCSPVSLTNTSLTPKRMNCMATSESFVDDNGNITVAEKESPYNWSSNSHSSKRRKSYGLSRGSPQVQQCGTPLARPRGCVSLMTSPIAKVSPGVQNNTSSQIVNRMKEFLNLGSLQSPPLFDCPDTMTPVPDMEKKLHVFCSACKTPLGLPENNFLITCSQTSSSKFYLRSLWKGTLDQSTSSSIPVLIANVASIDQRVCENSNESLPGGGSGQGTWCKEDGCVFKRVFCPSCSNPNCLGVEVMATDGSNISLQNKILLFVDLLEIGHPEAEKDKDLSPPSSDSCTVQSYKQDSIEKFAYFPPQQQISGGWRTTKSKMRLPKKNVSTSEED